MRYLLLLLLVFVSERFVEEIKDINYYEVAAIALIETFSKVLEDDFDQAIKEAWLSLWSLIVSSIDD